MSSYVIFIKSNTFLALKCLFLYYFTHLGDLNSMIYCLYISYYIYNIYICYDIFVQ